MDGGATSLDKSVCFRAQENSEYNFGKCLRCRNIANSENGIFDAVDAFGTQTSEKFRVQFLCAMEIYGCVGVLISRGPSR